MRLLRANLWTLRMLLLAGLVILFVTGWRMYALQTPLRSGIVPTQQLLQFSFTSEQAIQVRAALGEAGAASIRRQLAWDLLFIVEYVLLGFVLASWAFHRAIRRGEQEKLEEPKAETNVILVGAAGAHDLIENIAIVLVLNGTVVLQPLVFVTNLVKLAILITALIHIARQAGFWRPVKAPDETATPRRSSERWSISFEQLIGEETSQLQKAEEKLEPRGVPRQTPPAQSAVSASLYPDRKPYRVTTGPGAEPWVVSTKHDRFGIALSGGGIRSATFNLGLLQALGRLGVLPHVDYLSTVSGGGYVGGFWTRWLTHRANEPRGPGRSHFPLGSDSRSGERAEVRHLREFSRFLLPRAGISRNEFWSVVMTVLGGLLPSLVVSVALLAVLWAGWHWVTDYFLTRTANSMKILAVTVAVLLLGFESRWLADVLPRQLLKVGPRPGDERRPLELIGYLLGTEIIVAVVAIAWEAATDGHLAAMASSQAAAAAGMIASSPAKLAAALKDEASIIRWLAPAIPLALAAVLLLVLRPVVARALRDLRDPTGGYGVSMIVGFERSASRTLHFTAVAAALGLLWWAGTNVYHFDYATETVTTTAGLAALFAWLRKWLLEPVEETRAGRLLETVARLLRRAIPRILAAAVFLLLLILVAAGVIWSQGQMTNVQFGYLNIGYVVLMFVTLLCFDPTRIGLHEFYRSRISRCYLGASNADGLRSERARLTGNRSLNEHPKDDMYLGELRDAQVKPLHLICTAANDLAGDHLANLYRGARSAVLSQNGISIGNETAPLDYLRYSAALTASAAAFNSQMGRLSMRFGLPVSFMMSTLNLRLGLWVPHPRKAHKQRNYLLPGRFFVAELIGFSRANSSNLHLSDGGHFENTGLYELIRRHCRWIILSDCGADGRIVFDDLANVSRRVREDFGVEVELDVTPLSGDDGTARQHAVVGTIHYDGPTGADKGTILLFKPSLTGDEPADIVNYKVRTPDFPHESTGDQFFDEAQWESYRRLGEHAGSSALAFAERIDSTQYKFADRLFLQAREHLSPLPADQRSAFVDMSKRCAELEGDLASNGPEFLRREIYPEVAEFQAPSTAQRDEGAAISYLMRAIQIMEDVWLSCDLDRAWSHPLNEGWMNYFQRWASTPTFRRWWPVLRPIYSNGFREFAKDRFGVGLGDPAARKSDSNETVARLRLDQVVDVAQFSKGHAWRQFSQRAKAPDLSRFSTVHAYRLQLADGKGARTLNDLDVGFALADVVAGKNHTTVAVVDASHFFVAPALAGSGIIGRQLDALIQFYNGKVHVLMIGFPAESSITHLGPAAREDRVRQIEFFKSREFELNQDTVNDTVTLSRWMMPRELT